LDLSSRTSVVLARLLLRARRTGNEPRLVGGTPEQVVAAVRGTHGALVIGDPALAAFCRFPHVFDLGQAWLEHTGLPFVFAAWCGRAGALQEDDERILRDAKDLGITHRDAFANAHARSTSLPAPFLRAYLRDAIRYELGDEERAGLERFFAEAADARLLPRATVRFFDDDRVPGRPPAVGARAPVPLDTLLSRAAEGERLSATEGERLAAEGSLFDLGLAADAIRKRKHPDGVVTYIVDRNVNYTNVCTTSCRFCAFYRPVGHPEGYVLSREVLGQKLQEVVYAGGVQILLQGGLNPDLRIEWYEDLFRWMKREYGLGLHALSPEEILFIARLEGISTRRVLERLHQAGLDSVPGGGAEILVDRVRRRIAKAKSQRRSVRAKSGSESCARLIRWGCVRAPP
jgi:cyclic dehypoxanthinyl futalosine synthase